MQGESVPPQGAGSARLQRDSLQQQIYDHLCDRLVAGAFRPGEAISSRGLAQRLEVSAMPVREALTRLTAEGAIEMTSSRTLRVRLLAQADLDEITAIRIELEGMAAGRAAAQVTEADIRRVRALHVELTEAAGSEEVDRYLAANAAFHDGIYRGANWPILQGMIRRLWLTVGPSIRSSVPDRRHLATSMAFHDAALAALEAGSMADLRDAIIDDIGTAAEGIRARLESDDAPTGPAGTHALRQRKIQGSTQSP